MIEGLAVIFFLTVIFIIHFFTDESNSHMKERYEALDKQTEMLEESLDRENKLWDELKDKI